MNKLHNTYCIGLLSLILLLAASCSDHTDIPVNSGTAIGLDVDEATTKAHTQSVADIVSLGVFGYSTGTNVFSATNTTHVPNLLYNCNASKSNSTWSYSPNAYWPMDLTVKNTFFAYSPHSSKFPAEANVQISGPSASSYPTLNYTVPDQVARQVDILYSDTKTDTLTTANIHRNTNDGKVKFHMKHATAWIVFLIAPIKIANDNEAYTIKSFRFVAKTMTSRALLNLSKGTWVGLEASAVDYRFTPNPDPITVGGIKWATKDGERLMVIPETLSREVNEPYIHLSYTFNNGTTEDPDEYSYSLPFPETPLGAGRIVTYVLNISVDGIKIRLKDINTIEAWELEEVEEEYEVY